MNSKSKIALFVLIIVSVLILAIGPRLVFNSNTAKSIVREAQIKELEFSNNIDGELLLASKMAKSPIISAYMQDPYNTEIAEYAMDEIMSYQNQFKGKNTFSCADADLLYYSNGKVLYTLDKSDPNNSWFTDCLGLKEDYTFIVSYDIALKKSMLWVDAIVRDAKSKGIGLIGTGIDLSDFVNMMYSSLSEGTTMYFYNRKNEISGARDTKLLEAHKQITEILPSISAFEMFPKNRIVVKDKKGIYAISPIPSVDWSMVLFVPFTLKAYICNALLPFILVILAISLYAALHSVYTIVQPLASVNNTINDIGRGNADLTKRLRASGSSLVLIHNIENGFNVFMEKMQNIVSVIKDSKEGLFSNQNLLDECISNTVSAIDTMNSNLSGIESSIDNQTTSLAQAAVAVNQISIGIDSLNSMIDDQTRSVDSASDSIKQMEKSIGAVNSSVQTLSVSFKSLEDNTNDSVVRQQQVSERIEEILNQSQMLQDANRVISSIASQTNLLAMNAAIEAAHAGEAGRGFSVVADEIRKLSETSSAQSKTIGQQLKTIQASINGIVSVSEGSQSALRSVAEGIHSTTDVVKGILDSMEEQKSDSRRISDALSALQQSSTSVKNASKEMSAKNESVLLEAKALEKAAETMKDSMDNMNESVMSISSTASDLQNVSKDMNSSIRAISENIDMFKTK